MPPIDDEAGRKLRFGMGLSLPRGEFHMQILAMRQALNKKEKLNGKIAASTMI